MAFDAARRRVVLFGGQSGAEVLGDTWEWDGESWTQVADLGPDPRTEHSMAFDLARQRLVLFGGRLGGAATSSGFSDTWEWDGSNWTQVAMTGPSSRAGHAVVFSGDRNGVLLFGGEQGGSFFHDTWQWQGSEWVQVEDVGPSPRRGHAMTFDSSRRRVVLFGGEGPTLLGDTWEWDGGAWTQMSDFGPPARTAASLIADDRRTILFGGFAGPTGTLFRETWQWNGRHWTARQDMGPGFRRGHAMAYDTVRGRGVLFGGTASPEPAPTPLEALGDTWEEFERLTGREPEPAPEPGGTVESIDIVPRDLLEGQPFAVTVTLAGPATEAFSGVLVFHLRDTEVEIAAFAFRVDAGQTTVTTELGFAEGAYEVEAQPQGRSQPVSLTVRRNPDFQVTSLTAEPNPVSLNDSFVLTAQIDRPAPPGGLYVPTTLAITPEQSMILPILVPAGSTSGQTTLTAQEGLFFGARGRYPLSAGLGGVRMDLELEVV